MSGSNDYTEEEVAARTEQLQAGAAVLDRNKNQSAVDLVSGVQDLIYRALNSDVDSVYALLKLFANRHIIISSKILANIDQLLRYAPVSRQADPNPDTTKLDRLIELSGALEIASEGDREQLLLEFARVTEELVRSSVDENGVHNAGVSPTYAKEQSLAIAEETQFLMEVLSAEVPNFLGALDEYSVATLEPLSFENQAKAAASVLQSHQGSDDLSAALLDSVVLSALLGQRAAEKRDITIPKYEGGVVTLPGSRAANTGDTKPFIIQDTIESVEFAVDAAESATVSGDQSPAPTINFSLNSTFFETGDSGELFFQTTKQSQATEKWFSSSGVVTDPWLVNSMEYGGFVDDASNPVIVIPYLKTTTRPSDGVELNTPVAYENGVNVDFSWWSGTTNPVSCVDNGYGVLVDKNKTSINGHQIEPTPMFDGATDTFIFTGNEFSPFDPLQLQPHISKYSIIVIRLKDGTGGGLLEEWQTTTIPDPNNPGYFLCPLTGNGGAAPGSEVSVNFQTGEAIMDLGGYTPASIDFVEVTGYLIREHYGFVDYLTGHIFVRMPYVAQTDTGLYTNYKYLPLATLGTGDEVTLHPGQQFFSAFRAYSHNDLESASLPASTILPHVLSPGVPSEWLTTPQQLADKLIDSSLTDEFYISTEMQGLNTVFNFSVDLRGSMSRVAFPNYAPTALATSTSFAPTWDAIPSSINQAIGATYGARGEKFGRDTPFSEVYTDGGPVDVDCPENSLYSDVPLSPVAPGDKLELSGFDWDIEEGDDLRVRWDAGATSLTRGNPVFHTKVTHFYPGDPGDPDAVPVVPPIPAHVEVFPAVALTIDDAVPDQLTVDGVWACDISRSRIRVRSQSNEAESALTINSSIGGGLGFEDAVDASGNPVPSTGFSTEVELQVDLHGGYPRDGYEIHPNDIVLETIAGVSSGSPDILRHIGRVIRISGNQLTMKLVEGVSPEIYPYGQIKVVAYGWYKFITMVTALEVAQEELSASLGEGQLPDAAKVFVMSGSGQEQYMSLLRSLGTSMDKVRESYLLYDAHVVKTVDQLINTLKQERLSLPLTMLTTARFEDIADLTVEEVSEQSSIDNLLLAAFDKLGGETGFFEVTYGPSIMDDYYNRGEDEKIDDLINPATEEGL